MSVSFDFNFWTMLLFVCNFGLAVFITVSNRKKVENDELKAIQKALQGDIKASRESISRRIENHGDRLSRIESDIENSINDEDMKAIHRRVDELMSSSKMMEGQVSMIVSSLKDIHNLLLQKGMK